MYNLSSYNFDSLKGISYGQPRTSICIHDYSARSSNAFRATSDIFFQQSRCKQVGLGKRQSRSKISDRSFQRSKGCSGTPSHIARSRKNLNSLLSVTTSLRMLFKYLFAEHFFRFAFLIYILRLFTTKKLTWTLLTGSTPRVIRASIPNQLLNLTPRSEQHHLSPVRLPDSAPLESGASLSPIDSRRQERLPAFSPVRLAHPLLNKRFVSVYFEFSFAKL